GRERLAHLALEDRESDRGCPRHREVHGLPLAVDCNALPQEALREEGLPDCLRLLLRHCHAERSHPAGERTRPLLGFPPAGSLSVPAFLPRGRAAPVATDRGREPRGPPAL